MSGRLRQHCMGLFFKKFLISWRRSVFAGQGSRDEVHSAVRNEPNLIGAYGDPNVHPQSEDYWGHVNPVGPRSCYDEGKRCAETLFFDYWRQHRVPIKVARNFNTYGPRMHPNDGRVVSSFIVQALLGRDITVYGEGLQTRAFCYVDDLIDGLIKLMATGESVTRPINIGNPGEFSILQLATMVVDMTGSRSRIVHRPLPQNDPRQRRPDISRAQELSSWQPRTPLKEGLIRTIAYFEKLLSDNSVCDSLVAELSKSAETINS